MIQKTVLPDYLMLSPHITIYIQEILTENYNISALKVLKQGGKNKESRKKQLNYSVTQVVNTDFHSSTEELGVGEFREIFLKRAYTCREP